VLRYLLIQVPSIIALIGLALRIKGTDLFWIKDGWSAAGMAVDESTTGTIVIAGIGLLTLAANCLVTYWGDRLGREDEIARSQVAALDVLVRSREVRPPRYRGEIRANIMRPVTRPYLWKDYGLPWHDLGAYHFTLRPLRMIVCCSGSKGRKENSLLWAPGNGCAGLVWSMGQDAIGDFRRQGSGYRVTLEQKRLTVHLKLLYSYLITDDLGESRFGVINIETDDPALLTHWTDGQENPGPNPTPRLRRRLQEFARDQIA
jgi:hypothetical protein